MIDADERRDAITTRRAARARDAELVAAVRLSPRDARCEYRGVEGDRCELERDHDGPHEWPAFNAAMARAGFGVRPAARPPWWGSITGPTASMLADHRAAVCGTLRRSGSQVAQDATTDTDAPHIT